MKLPSSPGRNFASASSCPAGRCAWPRCCCCWGSSGYIYYLDVTIREAFEGRKFALPARVYGRALEVYPGLKLTREQFVEEFKSIGYHESPQPDEPATYKTDSGWHRVHDARLCVRGRHAAFAASAHRIRRRQGVAAAGARQQRCRSALVAHGASRLSAASTPAITRTGSW